METISLSTFDANSCLNGLSASPTVVVIAVAFVGILVLVAVVASPLLGRDVICAISIVFFLCLVLLGLLILISVVTRDVRYFS